jgi:K+-sensing histidine kinase KdpD
MTNRNDNSTAPYPRPRLSDAGIDKAALVSDVSHELRTLMGGIIGINELLLSSELSHHQRQLAQTVDQSSKALLAVLNDIVDLSRIEVGKLSIEQSPVDPQKIVDEVAQLNESLAAAKNVQLLVQTDNITELILSDAARLRQIVSTLVTRMISAAESDCVKFKASVERESEQNRSLQFQVETARVSEVDQIWLKTLGQAKSDDCRHDSRWISLYICHCLTQMLGGECGAEIKPDSCRLWSRIPVTEP